MSSVVPERKPLDAELTDKERELLSKMFSNPLLFPREFKSWISNYLALNGLDIPISQIQGFTSFSANLSEVATNESLAAGTTTYSNLATVGPELTGLPDGQYLIGYGCNASRDTQQRTLYYSPSFNGAAASDNDAAQVDTNTTDYVTLVRFTTETLDAGGNNSITMKYRQSGASTVASYKNRWLVCLRIANA